MSGKIFHFLRLSKSLNMLISQPGLQKTPASRPPTLTNNRTPNTPASLREMGQMKGEMTGEYHGDTLINKGWVSGSALTSCLHRYPEVWAFRGS